MPILAAISLLLSIPSKGCRLMEITIQIMIKSEIVCQSTV